MSTKHISREYTTRLLEMIEEGILDRDQVIMAFCKYLSEDHVRDMMHHNEMMPEEEEDNHAEVFEVPASTFANSRDDGSWYFDYMGLQNVDWEDPESVKAESEALAGWYWWTCLPGCMPDSDAFGPFKTEEEAEEASKAD